MIGLRHEHSPATLWLTADHLVLANRRVRCLSEKGGWRDVPPEHFARARALRNDASVPERKLWRQLRSSQPGVQFRRQHPIGPYIVDFYARACALVVEVDGAQHFAGDAAVARDRRRDAFLRSLGLRVMRFTTAEVATNLAGVTSAIHHAAQETVLAQDPEKQWRRAGDLRPGDTVLFGPELAPCRLVSVQREETQEEVYDIEVHGAHSFLTEVCVIHNCGCGTTTAVAERLGRRWIGIHITPLYPPVHGGKGIPAGPSVDGGRRETPLCPPASGGRGQGSVCSLPACGEGRVGSRPAGGQTKGKRKHTTASERR